MIRGQIPEGSRVIYAMVSDISLSTLREKELHKRSYKLAVIKCAEMKNIRIPPNRDVAIQGYTTQELPYQPVCCMMQPTDKAAIPHDLDIAPSLVSYQYRRNQLLPVHISNVSVESGVKTPKPKIQNLTTRSMIRVIYLSPSQ